LQSNLSLKYLKFIFLKVTNQANIRVDLGEMGWNGVGSIDVAHDRDQWRALVNTVMNLRVA
jgi:hypothetical protein